MKPDTEPNLGSIREARTAREITGEACNLPNRKRNNKRA